MQEIEIRRWCDRCYDKDGSKTPATVRLTVGIVDAESRAKPHLRRLDLCDVDGKELLDLRDFVIARGAELDDDGGKAQPPRGGRSSSPSTLVGPCPSCGVTRSGVGGMVTHIYRDHIGATPPDTPTTCPECGDEFETTRSAGVHRKLAHDRTAADDAYAALAGLPTKRRRKT